MSKCTNPFENIPIDIHLALFLEKVSWNCSEVIHPAWFLFWNPGKGAKIACGEEEFEATPEYAFLIPAYTAISGFSEGNFPHLYTHFSVGAPFDRVENRIYRLSPEPAKRFYEQFLHTTGVEKNLRWHILIMEYLAMLPEEVFSGELQIDPRIRKALQTAEKLKHIDNKTLAKAAGMSVNNFCRVFRKALKISPKRFFISMRLNTARTLLTGGNYSITEAAEHCGFADRYQFSKSFKEYFGITPGTLLRRKKNRSRR